ncbi:hypothetical protein GCM10010123_04130 [Pilimelia anulata]|uniref:Peptidase S1A alpha-lytic prodomain domain-containing protein n=1 Tax=Pilimelia anulata TaxID=53371 RepID=A0A8J3F7C3_9ACTN|nr:S1 family peptidase [Pilimelia anulata]GGJ77309.1 hypothetical protein GCM10010123_04130 [Pilimelia anulata]
MGTPAAAQTGTGTGLSTLSDAIQRDLGLTPAAAEARWAADERAGAVERALAARLGERFAGAWITDTGLSVAITDPAAAEEVRAAGATPVAVPRTAAALAAVQARLDATKAPAAVRSWYTDVTTNRVVVTATSDAAARDFVAAAGVDPAAIGVEVDGRPVRTLADVVGGNAYRMGGGRCSVGFPVQGGFATAGHCGKQGTSTSGPTGTFRGSSFPGNDYAWVAVTGADRPVGAVNDYKNGRVPVQGSQQATTGAQVCRSGSTTGWHCGSIQGFNASVTYKEGTVSGLIRTNVCAEPGDSGGSLLAGSQAQGVTSGGSGNCRSGGTTYFQPVNEILQAYNLRILTGGMVG